MNKKLKTDIVPWKNPAEFIKVYECAYSDDLNKNQWAVEQMTVWETRCWPSLPTAVEATLLFVRSKIQDQLYEASKSFYNAQEIEMMYSNAVVRFINLLLEKDQNSKQKKALAYLAAERNIPIWIVDIRHSATHGFHPTLPVLRMAHITIMKYLENIFWLPEKSRVCAMKKTIDETPFVELVQDYRVKQFQVIADDVKEHQNRASGKKISAVQDKVLQNLRKIRARARDRVLAKMDELLKKPDSRKTLLDVLVRDFVNMDDIKEIISNDQNFMSTSVLESNIALPSPLKDLYYPLIRLMHKHDLVSTFIELLLLTQEKRELVILQKVVDYAVMYFLDLAQASPKTTKDEYIPFICKGANLNLYRILYACVRGCSTTGKVVVRRLMSELRLGGWINDLTTMMEIKLGTVVDSEPEAEEGEQETSRSKGKSKFDITFTVEDLEEDIFEEVEKKHQNFIRKGPWSLAPLKTDWASIPIGHVSNPVGITEEEDPNEEGVISSEENNKNKYVCEESKPIVMPVPEKFLFSDRPNRESILYKRKHIEFE